MDVNYLTDLVPRSADGRHQRRYLGLGSAVEVVAKILIATDDQ